MGKDQPASILIIKLSAIGDVVHALPALEVLRKNFPTCRIDWLVEEEAFPIIQGHKDIDEILVSRRKRWTSSLLRLKDIQRIRREAQALVRILRSREYELVIDFQGLLKSGVFACLAKGRRKVGMAGAREGARFFLSEPPYPVSYDQHAIDRYLEFCCHLGCSKTQWSGRIPYEDSHVRRVRELLQIHGINGQPIIAINPVARWETKLWPLNRFAALADRVQQEWGLRVVFTGSGADTGYIEAIRERMKTDSINLAGQTSLKDLACLYDISRLLVTTDTGPMHIAAAMGCPVVALFGPTDPRRTGPYGNPHRVIRLDLECSPCFKRKCYNTKCMDNIQVAQAFEALREILVKDTRGNRLTGIQ